MHIDRNEVRKILIIKLRGIGDVILSTAVINNLLEEFKGSKIDFLTEKPGKIALTDIKKINEIIVFNRKSASAKFKQILDIRRRQYDLVFDFFSNPTTALITFFSGAKYRAGFPYRGRKYAYNLYAPEERNKYHAAELHLKTLEKIGIPVKSQDLLFSLSEIEKQFAEKFWKENGLTGKNVLGICPSGGWQSKKCPPFKFAQFTNAILTKYEITPIILWGPGDHEDAIQIRDLVSPPPVLIPDCSIKEMGAIISKCTLLLANDSGPMHISAAAGTPVIALFGPTNPKLQGPFGNSHEIAFLSALECINCDLTECPKKQECFTGMTDEYITELFLNLIRKNNISLNKRDG